MQYILDATLTNSHKYVRSLVIDMFDNTFVDQANITVIQIFSSVEVYNCILFVQPESDPMAKVYSAFRFNAFCKIFSFDVQGYK